MLPKPEKIKKGQSAEQLDLVDSISRADKIKYKRRFVLISLIVTVGLSFSFWFYRSFQHFRNNFTYSQFRLNLSIPKIKTENVKIVGKFSSTDLDKLLLNDHNKWIIHAQLIGFGDELFTYTKDLDNSFSVPDMETIINTLNNQPFSTQSLIQTGLPKGTKIKELINTSQNSYDSKYLIMVPQNRILITVYITGEDIQDSINKIPQIIGKVYWQIMENH